MSKISISWSILQFKPNAHKLAEHNLKLQKYKTFLPLEKVSRYKNQQLILLERPLFPGYMFVAFEKESIPWHKINCTYGVSKLLTINNRPYIAPHSLIDGIKARCDQNGVLLPQKHFSKGDKVRLVSGPFDDFLATVESIDKNQRIWVLMDFMGKTARTIINPEKLNIINN